MVTWIGIAAAVLLMCGALIGLTRREGCLAGLLRLVALIAAVGVPLWMVQPREWTAISVISVLVGISTLSFAVTMTAVAWGSLVPFTAPPKTKRKGKIESEADDLESRIDLSIFNPFSMFTGSVSSRRSGSDSVDDFIGSIILAIVVMVLGVLFWIGLQVAILITRWLPQAEGAGKRMFRALVGFALAFAVLAATMYTLDVLRASSPVDTPALPLSTVTPEAPIVSTNPIPTLSALYPTNLNRDVRTIWEGVEKPGEFTSWRIMFTPPFPEVWPPTGSSGWIQYVYAYGQEPQLADGVRVAKPWAELRIGPGGLNGTLNLLSGTLEPAGIQGVFPLPEAQAAIVRDNTSVVAMLWGLGGLPSEAQAAPIRAYYDLWLRTNGAILEVLPVEAGRTAFISWVKSE